MLGAGESGGELRLDGAAESGGELRLDGASESGGELRLDGASESGGELRLDGARSRACRPISPWAVNFKALPARFTTICRKRSGSPIHTSGTSWSISQVSSR